MCKLAPTTLVPIRTLVCLTLMWLGACGTTTMARPSTAACSGGPSYQWQSPHGWKEERFALPPKRFAPNLGLQGREVLHFAPGYFKAEVPDAWTYAFVLLVDNVTELSELPIERLREALHTYFLGLGRHLGKKHKSDLATDRVVIEHVTSEATDVGMRHRFQGTVFDPWSTASEIPLHLTVEVWPCGGGKPLAIFISASPQPYGDGMWKLLEAERAAFRCGC